ncbi:unnamed protein product [Arctogadus glacialis]
MSGAQEEMAAGYCYTDLPSGTSAAARLCGALCQDKNTEGLSLEARGGERDKARIYIHSTATRCRSGWRRRRTEEERERGEKRLEERREQEDEELEGGERGAGKEAGGGRERKEQEGAGGERREREREEKRREREQENEESRKMRAGGGGRAREEAVPAPGARAAEICPCLSRDADRDV